MVDEREIASATGRRSVGNQVVTKQHWEGFEKIMLSGLRTSVESIDLDRDIDGIFTAATEGERSEQIWDYMSYGPFSNKIKWRNWLLNCVSSKDPAFVVFRDKMTKQIGGMGSFMRIQLANGVSEIGNIWFSLSWQNTVRSTEVLSLMMCHVLETQAYRRLEWKCDALNVASRSAALRLGFRYEGVFLNHMIVKGRNRDTAWFSLTKEEWPEVYAAHTRWLSPENFDTTGRQKCSLSSLTSAIW